MKLESVSAHALAKGMEVDNRNRTLKLERVNATYKPQPRTPAQ